MKLNISVPIPEGVVPWQVRCECGAAYAMLHSYEADAPRPKFCAFCGARAAFSTPTYQESQ